VTHPPSDALDLTPEQINTQQTQLELGKIVQTREKVRIWMIVGLTAIVVGILWTYIAAAWNLVGDVDKAAAWEHVNAVAGLALTSFLTLLGGAVGWYFSEQANRI